MARRYRMEMNKGIYIRAVSNGFLVECETGAGTIPDEFIASTPHELGELITKITTCKKTLVDPSEVDLEELKKTGAGVGAYVTVQES